MTQHKLITAKDRKVMEANWSLSQRSERADSGLAEAAGRYSAMNEKPVIKLFDPWGQAFWLLVELEPTKEAKFHGDPVDMAFGLADLGLGFPELGYVSVDELRGMTYGPDGPPRIERDLYFRAEKTLAEYLTDAKEGIRP
jgi:hypothetical protein